ncbi:MAG: hypothetical protein WCA16_03765, partial [Candidatus Sulfotelmatobacter sp.]
MGTHEVIREAMAQGGAFEHESLSEIGMLRQQSHSFRFADNTPWNAVAKKHSVPGPGQLITTTSYTSSSG